MSTIDVTELLEAVNCGSPRAYGSLMEEVYAQLRRLAGGLMRQERKNHTLQPTALVNEAYLRLVRADSKWENRTHFMGAAATAMRRILVEHARQRSAKKRGGDDIRVTFGDVFAQAEDPQVDLLALDEALSALGGAEPRLVKVVELRYFAGFSLSETAEILDISTATVKRDWVYARAWLYDYMKV